MSVREELGHVDADSASTHHGDGPTHGRAFEEHLSVGQHLRVVDSGDVRDPRLDAGRDDDIVEVHQVGHLGPTPEMDLDALEVEAGPVVPDRLCEILLALNTNLVRKTYVEYKSEQTDCHKD